MNRDLLKMQLTPKDKVLEIYFYSEIAPDGYDWWTDERIPSETSANTIRETLEANPECKEIHMFINSCGGIVAEGYAIYAQLQRFDGEITCWVDGFANSIASIIALAADKVVMYQNSVMTIHNAIDWCYGNASDHRKCADQLDKLMEGNRQLYLAKSGGKLTEKKLIELLDAETMLSAQDCLNYGLCDEIIGQDCDMEKSQEMIQRETNRFSQATRQLRAVQMAYREAMQFQPIPREASTPKPVDESTFMACFKAQFNL